jgi:hypothetical protein
MARIMTHIRLAVDQNVHDPPQGQANHTDANHPGQGVSPGNPSTK